MMNKQIEALKMAIEALESVEMLPNDKRWYLIGSARKACKEALSEDALNRMARNAEELGLDYDKRKEPVAWMEEYQSCKVSGDERLCHSDKVFRLVQLLASQSKEWQSLSDDELLDIANKSWEGISPHADTMNFARAIEQALKEKNQ